MTLSDPSLSWNDSSTTSSTWNDSSSWNVSSLLLTNETCSSTESVHIFIHSSFVTAVAIVVLMSFYEKRQSLNLGCCGGRPGLTVPINLLDDYKNRWSYACSFGAITNTLIVLFVGPQYFGFDSSSVAKVFVGLVTAVEVCVIFYPFFACISTRHVKVGSLVGFIYVTTWLSFSVNQVVRCMLNPLPEFPPNGGLIISLPTIVCLFGVTLRFFFNLCRACCCCCCCSYCSICCRRHTSNKNTSTGVNIAHPWQINYVRRLINGRINSAPSHDTFSKDESSQLSSKKKFGASCCCCTSSRSDTSQDDDDDSDHTGNESNGKVSDCRNKCRTKCSSACNTFGLWCNNMCTKFVHSFYGLIETCRKFIIRSILDQRPEFKYSTRMVCSLFVVLCCTYQMAALFYFASSYFIESAYTQLDAFLELTGIQSNTSAIENIHLSIDMLYVSWQVITAVSSVLFILNMCAILIRYRKNMMQMFRGEKFVFIPPSVVHQSSADIVRNCMLFGGFQIAYMVWGFFLANLVLWILALLFCFIILLPLFNGVTDIVEWFLSICIIPLIVSVLLRALQTVMATLFFLQDKHNKKDKVKPLALNNIKAFHVMNYFFFMANIETGFFSCLYRILQGLIYGLVFLGRLDRCVLMPGFETSDKGYTSYIGILYMEHTHNNPSLRTFCQILVDLYAARKQHCNELNGADDDSFREIITDTPPCKSPALPSDEKDSVMVSQKHRSDLVKRRWHLLYTLVHNTQLVVDRRNGTSIYKDNIAMTSDVLAIDSLYQQYAVLKLSLRELEAKVFHSGAVPKLTSVECQTNDVTLGVERCLSEVETNDRPIAQCEYNLKFEIATEETNM